jgi:hypothetical protein
MHVEGEEPAFMADSKDALVKEHAEDVPNEEEEEGDMRPLHDEDVEVSVGDSIAAKDGEGEERPAGGQQVRICAPRVDI